MNTIHGWVLFILKKKLERDSHSWLVFIFSEYSGFDNLIWLLCVTGYNDDKWWVGSHALKFSKILKLFRDMRRRVINLIFNPPISHLNITLFCMECCNKKTSKHLKNLSCVFDTKYKNQMNSLIRYLHLQVIFIELNDWMKDHSLIWLFYCC